jgi:hypothetical protein
VGCALVNSCARNATGIDDGVWRQAPPAATPIDRQLSEVRG